MVLLYFMTSPLVSRMESLFVFFDIKAPKRVEQSAGFKIAALICVKFSLCLLRSFPLRNFCCFEPFKVSNSLINIEEQQMTIKNQNLMFRVMQENYPKNL